MTTDRRAAEADLAAIAAGSDYRARLDAAPHPLLDRAAERRSTGPRRRPGITARGAPARRRRFRLSPRRGNGFARSISAA
jgi:hypothetical protein